MSVARTKGHQGRERFAPLEDDPCERGIVDLLARAAVLIPLMALPWLFGGVYASSQLFLVAGVSLSLFCWLIDKGNQSISPTVCIIPLLLAVALGAAQLIPANPRVLAQISPRSLDFWQMFAPVQGQKKGTGLFYRNGPEGASHKTAPSPFSDQPQGADERTTDLPTESDSPTASDSPTESAATAKSESQFAMDVGYVSAGPANTISLYPDSTRHDLAMLLLAVAVFFLGTQLFGRADSQLPLYACVSATGAALAFFGIAQQLGWNGLLYGRFPLTYGGSPFAAFINRNNAGGFLNLCLACAIGFTMCISAREARPHLPIGRRSALRAVWEPFLGFVARLNGPKIFATLALVVIGAGLVAALSRGAWVSMFVATLVLVAVLQMGQRNVIRLWLLPLVMVLAVGLVIWIGKGDAVNQRWQTLRAQIADPSDGRLEHWRDGLAAGSDFWLTGSGLGTYRYIYRPYVQTGGHKWFFHAENQYVEAFVEGGLLGLGLMLTAIGIVAIACWRLLQEPRYSTEYICGVVGVYALVSQSVHALFDFGLYITANTALLAIVCGTVTGCAARVQLQSHRHRHPGRSFPFSMLALPANRTLFTSVATGLLCFMLYAFVQIQSAGAIESALRSTRQTESTGQQTLADVSSNIQQMGAAAAQRPADAEAQLRLAQLHIQRFRLQAVRDLRDQFPDLSETELYQLTAPISLHAIAHRFQKQGQTIELRNLRRDSAVQSDLQSAARHLYAAAAACPLLPRVPLLLAEIGGTISEHASDTAQLARARRLTVSSYDLMTECGLASLQAGETAAAVTHFRRSVEISSQRLVPILRLVAEQSDATTAARVVPYSSTVFIELLRKNFGSESDTAMRLALVERATELSQSLELDEAVHWFWQGMLHAVHAKNDQAIDSIKRAVELRPEMTAWRYELAVLLHSSKELDDAWEHARICVRMDPQDTRFNALLKELIHTRSITQ